MSGFKERIAADKSVFLNSEEFADRHVIDGVEVSAVIDESTDNENPLSYAEGVSVIRLTVYVDPDQLGYTPVQDQNMVLDGYAFQVVQINHEGGMLAIRLERNVG